MNKEIIDNKPTKKHNFQEIKLEVFERKILLKIPKNEQDIAFIRKITYSKWDSTFFHWVIPNFPGNLERIKAYFNERITTYVEHQNEEISLSNVSESITKSKNEVLLIKTLSGRLRILFGFNQQLMIEIKKIPYHSWDSKNKWWTIPFSEVFKDCIIRKTEELGLHYSFKEEENNITNSFKRITAFDIPNYKKCPENFILKIRELRYSSSTEKTYRMALEDFINYHHTVDLDKLNESHIQSFLRHLVMERNVSTSYQNQAINAIKFYYERVLGGQRKTYFIDRPKKEKTLPVVLSEEEIIEIISSIQNIKHKAIIMTIYSAGLRISECVHLKIKDIDSNRMQIRVEQAKGKKR